MGAALARKEDEFASKQRLVAELFTKDPQTGDYNMDADTVAEIQRRNLELNALQSEIAQTKQLEMIEGGLRPSINGLQKPVTATGDEPEFSPRPRQRVDAGLAFINSRAYREYRQGNSQTPDYEETAYDPTVNLFAATMTEAAGFAPQAIRTGRVVDIATRPPRVIDAYPITTTNQIAVVFMVESTFTNAAAETAESSGTIPDAALVYTETTSTVRKIAINLPVTSEQLADVQGMQDRINNRLELMLRQRLDLQLMAGNGTPPNLAGLIGLSGVQTQALGSDPTFDAFQKAIVLVQFTGFAEPDTILMHPADWQDVVLTRTGDGLYIMGNPAFMTAPRLWGLPVIISTAVTQNTGLVGDFSGYAEVAFKQGIEFSVTNSNASEFLNDILRIKASIRVAHVVYRPAAFAQVTGI